MLHLGQPEQRLLHENVCFGASAACLALVASVVLQGIWGTRPVANVLGCGCQSCLGWCLMSVESVRSPQDSRQEESLYTVDAQAAYTTLAHKQARAVVPATVGAHSRQAHQAGGAGKPAVPRHLQYVALSGNWHNVHANSATLDSMGPGPPAYRTCSPTTTLSTRSNTIT